MWWKVGKEVEQDKQAKDLLARFIPNAIVRIQLKTVAGLKSWELRYSLKQKKIGLLLFTLIGMAYMLLLLGKALFVSDAPKSTIDINHIQPPFIPPVIKLLDTVNTK